MRIEKARLEGFGKLVGRVFAFEAPLTCVYGPNEAGKTTLLTFLASMLYGQATPGLRVRRLEDTNARYRPWSGVPYAGQVTLLLSPARRLIVKRDFSGTADGAEILDAATGKSLEKDYFRDALREYTFADEETRVDKATFEGVFVVRHESVATLAASGGSRLADRLSALADSASEGGGSDKAGKALEKARAAIGSDRAPKQPYARTREALETARRQFDRVKAAHAEYTDTLVARAEHTGDVKRLQGEYAAAHARLLHSIASALGALDGERRGLDERAKALAGADALPATVTAEALARLEAALSSATKALDAARGVDADAGDGLQSAQKAVDALGPYATLEETALRAAEDAVAEFVEARRRLVEKLADAADADAKVSALEGKWAERRGALETVGKDDEDFLSRAGEAESSARRRLSETVDKASEAQGRRERERKLTLAWGIAAAVGLAGAAVSFALAPGAARFAASGALFAAAVVAGALVIGSVKRGAQAAFEEAALRRDADGCRSELTRIETHVAAILKAFPDRTREALLAALAEFHGDEKSLTGLRDEQARKRGDARTAGDDVAQAMERMEGVLPPAGLATGGRLTDAVARFGAEPKAGAAAGDWRFPFADATRTALVKDAFAPLWERLNEAREARSARKGAQTEVTRCIEALRKAQDDFGTANSALEALLLQGNAASADDLRGAIKRRAELAEVRVSLRAVDGRERVLLGGMPRAEFEKTLADAERSTAEPVAEPDVPAFREKVAAMARDLAASRRERDIAAARIDEGLKNVPEMASVEERIAELEERHRLQQLHRDAVDAAYRVVTEAAGAFHDDVYPRIEERLQESVCALTLGAHEEVHVSGGEGGSLVVSVLDGSRGAPVAPSDLSRGALEQVYLCARLALAEALSGEETAPMLLDDPFINYDPERLKAGVALLSRAAARHQVVLFTCQRDVRDLAAAAGAGVVEL